MLTPDDLTPFADIAQDKAEAMIADAMAMATLIAPCINDVGFDSEDALKAILRGAILRWHEAGTGAFSQEQAGVYSVTYDTRQQRRSMFWPSEIAQLQSMCRDSQGAYSVDTVGMASVQHADVCSANLGALYCSCGAVLTGAGPLWEV